MVQKVGKTFMIQLLTLQVHQIMYRQLEEILLLHVVILKFMLLHPLELYVSVMQVIQTEMVHLNIL